MPAGGFEKFRNNIIPDILDNFPPRNELKTFEAVARQSEQEHALVLDKMLPLEKREQLLSLTENLASNHPYEHLSLVGDKARGTLHPHLFAIESNDVETLFFFVDPEHNVGKQNLLRPRIGNLMTMRLPRGGGSPEIIILRFSTEGIKPDDLKLKAQLAAAREMTANEGVPAILADRKKNILFRIAALKDKIVLQARYTNTNKAQAFLKGGKGSRALRGKMESQEALVDRFIKLLKEDKFTSAGKIAQAKKSDRSAIAA